MSSTRLVTQPREEGVTVKPTPSRVDYILFNYCSGCALKFPKEVLRCIQCNQKVRTKPWHRSKTREPKRI